MCARIRKRANDSSLEAAAVVFSQVKDNQFYTEKIKMSSFYHFFLLEFVTCYVHGVFSKLLYFENPFKGRISSYKSI